MSWAIPGLSSSIEFRVQSKSDCFFSVRVRSCVSAQHLAPYQLIQVIGFINSLSKWEDWKLQRVHTVVGSRFAKARWVQRAPLMRGDWPKRIEMISDRTTKLWLLDHFDLRRGQVSAHLSRFTHQKTFGRAMWWSRAVLRMTESASDRATIEG